MFGVCYSYYFSFTALMFTLTKMVMCDRSETMKMALGVVATKTEFPYLCSVVYKQDWVGACSILTSDFIIVSVSNLNQPISQKPDEEKRYYNDIWGLSVYAGSIYMNPSLYEKDKIAGLQEVKVNSFYVAYDADNLRLTRRIRPPEDKNFNLNSILKLDVVGAAFNVGFLKVNPFKWTSSVRPLPLPMKTNIIQSTTTKRISALEKFPFSNSNCKIAAWHYPTSRKIFHHVLYIPARNCQQAYCSYNLNACLKFPRKDHLICFKSAYWGEPCARDTGAALFCKFFEGGNIFAILTTAISCGNDNLPCVYTTMPLILQVYETIWQKYTPPIVPA